MNEGYIYTTRSNWQKYCKENPQLVESWAKRFGLSFNIHELPPIIEDSKLNERTKILCEIKFSGINNGESANRVIPGKISASVPLGRYYQTPQQNLYFTSASRTHLHYFQRGLIIVSTPLPENSFLSRLRRDRRVDTRIAVRGFGNEHFLDKALITLTKLVEDSDLWMVYDRYGVFHG